MDNKNTSKTQYKYVCGNCSFYSNNKKDYRRHLQTIKHNDNKNGNKKTSLTCNCGKTYKFMSGLSRHKKKCDYEEPNQHKEISHLIDNSNNTITKDDLIKQKNEEITDLKSMFIQLMNTNKEMQQQLIELAKQPKTYIKHQNNTNTNNNNTFNLENFLNIQCKDAMNLTDFVESLKITFKDLLYLGDNGFVKSIQNTFVKQLKCMEQNKRPIHCTDKKRKTIYVKDENAWNKDANHQQVTNAISTMNKKQYRTLSTWFKENPEWSSSSNIQMSCLEIMSKLNGLDEEDGEKNKKKIVNKIIENTILDKE